MEKPAECLGRLNVAAHPRINGCKDMGGASELGAIVCLVAVGLGLYKENDCSVEEMMRFKSPIPLVLGTAGVISP